MTGYIQSRDFPHRFTGLRQWGISPADDKPCQVCGVLKAVHQNPALSEYLRKVKFVTRDEQFPHLPLVYTNAHYRMNCMPHSPAQEIRGLDSRGPWKEGDA